MKLNSDQLQAVREALRAEMLEWLDDAQLIDMPVAALSGDERLQLDQAARNALANAGPIVRSYLARRAATAYPVWIAGIAGVYLLIAAGHDTLGPYATLADAVDAMDEHHGEFLTAG